MNYIIGNSEPPEAPEPQNEEERLALYQELTARGLSDYEARGTAWPEAENPAPADQVDVVWPEKTEVSIDLHTECRAQISALQADLTQAQEQNRGLVEALSRQTEQLLKQAELVTKLQEERDNLLRFAQG